MLHIWSMAIPWVGDPMLDQGSSMQGQAAAIVCSRHVVARMEHECPTCAPAGAAREPEHAAAAAEPR
eukprot:4184780-Prymnesium_polylepis.1